MESRATTVSHKSETITAEEPGKTYEIIDLTDKSVRSKKKIVICCGKETGSGTNFGQCITSVF